MSNAKGNRKSKGTLFLYAASAFVFLISIAALVNHILYFNTIVNQYVAQGYPLNEILSQLVPSQFLPGLFQSLALFMGVAIVLFGLGMVNEKLFLLTSPTTTIATESESSNTLIETETEVESTDAAAEVSEEQPATEETTV